MRKLMLYEKYPVLSVNAQKSLEAYQECKDAARYKWIRSAAADDFLDKYNADAIPSGKVLDDEIDRAMSAKK